MTIVAVAQAVVIVLLVAALVVREREHDEAVKWLVREDADERQVLLQRIQSPETAVVEHVAVGVDEPMPQPPVMDDDKGYWDARREMTSAPD